MQENDEEEEIYLGMVKSGKTAGLKFLFIQLRPTLFRQLVMWISAIKAVLFLMATMIRLLRDLIWHGRRRCLTVSVIVIKYIDLYSRRVKETLFGYGIDLAPEMEEAVQGKLAELKQP